MGLPDPAWKSGPTIPEPSASEHAFDIHEAPTASDIDGVGVDEAERIDGTPLLAVREVWRCPRDGCDASHRRVHLYRLEDVDEAHRIMASNEAPDRVEFIASHATIVDHDSEHPYIGFEVDGDVHGYVGPCETITTDNIRGPCYGRVEPEPDLESYRYDL